MDPELEPSHSVAPPFVRSLPAQPPPNGCNKSLKAFKSSFQWVKDDLRNCFFAESYALRFGRKGGAVLERRGPDEPKWSGSITFHWGSLLTECLHQQKSEACKQPRAQRTDGRATALMRDESKVYSSG